MYMEAKDLQNLWNNPRDAVDRYRIVTAAGPDLTSKMKLTTSEAYSTSYKRSITLSEARMIMQEVRRVAVTRDRYEIGNRRMSKWLRPWMTVPKIREFVPPAGDFGVGIEIEMGFTSQRSASTIAHKVKNWKYLALDWEGGSDPIEATFAPILYSKFGSRSQPVRYAKILKENTNLIYPHSENMSVGTHVNVSSGTTPIITSNHATRIRDISTIIRNSLTRDQKRKYFGRSAPYGYMYIRGNFVECKMFNSVPDPAVLRRYVHVAVALVKLGLDSNEEITTENVINVLEQAYNKR